MDLAAAAALVALALARRARLGERDAQVARRAGVGLLEADGDGVLVVCPAFGPALLAKRVPTSKHVGKDVGRESAWRTLGRVVILALFGVGQRLVRLLNLFELFRVTTFVWVVRAGKGSISLFYLLGRGALGDAQLLIEAHL
jgi:hypothetical protein